MSDHLNLEEEIIEDTSLKEVRESIISVDRISRTVAGGRRMRFRVLIAIGDNEGKVAIGIAKGSDVQTALTKARHQAKQNMFEVPIVNDTIPHQVSAVVGATKVIMKPAPSGHSIIAGGAIRPIIELSGIKNIVCKSIGSSNKINNAYAAIKALSKLKVGSKHVNK